MWRNGFLQTTSKQALTKLDNSGNLENSESLANSENSKDSNKQEALLQVKNLELTFSSDFGDKTYLSDMSFEVYPGEILGIVGESGSGKSITSLAIMQLLAKNGRISNGEILFKGEDLVRFSDDQMDEIRGRHISMIFQDALTSLNPVFTVGNQMREAVRSHKKMTKQEANEESIRLLTMVGLPSPRRIMRSYPHSLSGGMQQRVMIAMAMASFPEILIADEPTTALDVTVQAQIMALLKQLAQDHGTAIMLITHDIGLIAQMADRVLVMYAGQMVEESSLHTLFENPCHPYTMALMRSVPSITDDPDRELRSIPGVVTPDYNEILGCRFYDRCEFATDECLKPQALIEVEPGHRSRCHLAKAFAIRNGHTDELFIDKINKEASHVL